MKNQESDSKLRIRPGIYAIAGISKNSGKTSLLNHLLNEYADHFCGVLTTGRDGEGKDVVYGNPKPPVRLTENTIFSTTTEIQDTLGSAVQVLEKLPYNAANQQLWLLKANSEIETEIVGPPTSAEQFELAKTMQKNGAEYVFIDGSLDRKSIACNHRLKGIFLVVGSSFGSLDKIETELSRLIELSRLRPFRDYNLMALEDNICIYHNGLWQRTGQHSLLGNEEEIAKQITGYQAEKIFLPGAVTDASLSKLKPALGSVKDFIVRHPLHLHLVKTNLDNLSHSLIVYSLRPFKITAIAVNSWSVTGSHLDCSLLREKIRHIVSHIPVIDICET